MADIFLLPLLAAVLAMIFSSRCMSGCDFPFASLFTCVIGFMAFGAVAVLMIIYTILKVFLP